MGPEILSSRIEDYLMGFIPARSPEMEQMEADAEETGFPIVGPLCGHLCYQLARMIGARQIFELGSGYGYSTAWLARAVKENGGGTVHHVVWNEEQSQQAREILGKMGFDGIVSYRVGEAVEAFRESPGPFDLVFCDINKKRYPKVIPLAREKIRSGGLLIADNMLMGCRIFDEEDHARNVEGIREFTRRVKADPDWIVSVIPIRDGLMVALKR